MPRKKYVSNQLVLFSTTDKIPTVDVKDHFIFHSNKKVLIPNTPKDLDDELHYQTSVWSWYSNGSLIQFDWDSVRLSIELKELLKGYVFFRLQNRAASTVLSMDLRFIRSLESYSTQYTLTWGKDDISQIINHISYQEYFSFKLFYQWGIDRQISFFIPKLNQIIVDLKPKRGKSSYDNIFLRQHVTSEEKIEMLLFLIENETFDFSIKYFEILQSHILIRICFELGCRPVQIYQLDVNDLQVYENKQSRKIYFSLNLPMAKKKSLKENGKRFRQISEKLGTVLEKLIELNKKIWHDYNEAMFRHIKTSKRLTAIQIGSKIVSALKGIGLSANDLRHHLGQSLADQGVSADIIAEILGHNSTIPSRAYITASPKIAEIKTIALAKNENYRTIINMFKTGKIIEKKNSLNSQRVRGLVGKSYIGDIGACGISPVNVCHKNPIYSCYTCKMFNPFSDGDHGKLLTALELRVQQFIDTAELKMDINFNRTIIQLKETIIAVKAVINKLNSNI